MTIISHIQFYPKKIMTEAFVLAQVIGQYKPRIEEPLKRALPSQCRSFSLFLYENIE